MKALPITVHSNLLEQGGPAIKLWYLVRALDTTGKGKATFKLQEVLDALSISYPTFRRYVRNKTYFRLVINRKGVYTLYYNSQKRVAETLQTTYGTCTEVLVEHLPTYKIMAAEIVAQGVQDSSKFKAFRNKQKRQALPNLLKLFSLANKDTSEISTGVKIEGNRVYLHEGYACFGGSQATTAAKLGCSVRTIQRRLKNTRKLRLNQTSKQMTHIYKYYKFVDSENWSNFSKRFFIKDGLVYKALTNVYYPIYQLKALRHRKSELKVESSWSQEFFATCTFGELATYAALPLP